jgi:hypothetical protein
MDILSAKNRRGRLEWVAILPSRTSRINSNLRVLEHVLIPLRIRSSNVQEVQSVAFDNEPDPIRDYLPGLPADDAEFDLAVPGEAIF